MHRPVKRNLNSKRTTRQFTLDHQIMKMNDAIKSDRKKSHEWLTPLIPTDPLKVEPLKIISNVKHLPSMTEYKNMYI